MADDGRFPLRAIVRHANGRDYLSHHAALYGATTSRPTPQGLPLSRSAYSDRPVDPSFRRTFFLSNKLAQALIEKDLAQDFGLRWARVL